MLLRTRTLVLTLAATSLLAACGKKEADGAAAASPAASAASATANKAALLVAPEDLLTLALSAHASGPVITGAIQPERRADLRAEVGTDRKSTRLNSSH